MKAYALDVQGLTVCYEDKCVLEDVSWQVPAASLAAIIGPNGGGKSTLLKALVGMVAPNSGLVSLFGSSPKQARTMVAYLPQWEEVDWLFPISSLEVVLQGRIVHGRWWQRASKADKQLAQECLERVGMAGYASQAVGTLSGGQKQRVFIARALAQQAQMIILDEPATGLDAVAQHQLLELYEQLKRAGHTIVITTHDLNCLAEHFQYVLGLNRQVVVAGNPKEVLTAGVLTKLFAKHFPMMNPAGEVAFHDH